MGLEAGGALGLTRSLPLLLLGRLRAPRGGWDGIGAAARTQPRGHRRSTEGTGTGLGRGEKKGGERRGKWGGGVPVPPLGLTQLAGRRWCDLAASPGI